MATVEIILKKKIEGLGAEADIVTVKPGYARNYLIPRDMAAPATLATKKQVEDLKRKRAEREAEELNKAQEVATQLGRLKLSFTLTAGGDQSKVFGAVTAQDIADKLKESGYEIDKKKIELAKPIKDSGEHEVVVHLAHGVLAKLDVIVATASAKKEDEAEQPAAKKGKKSAASKEPKTKKS
jgi:large subunit ribosomal protein L9